MNTIDRMYRSRGRPVHIQEITDLAAVPPGRKRPSREGDTVESVVLPHVHAFEDAGWSFVPRNQAGDGAKVYLRPSGRVAIGTDRLTVRITESRTEEEAQDILGRLGVEVLERLKFARNLFVVAAPDGHDAVEMAERLGKLGEVEFAEPVFIEMIPAR